MGYAELIQKKLQTLSPEQQAQVLALVDALADAVVGGEKGAVASSPLAWFRAHPIQLDEPFVALTREDANAR
jgi:hypothetical protein